MRQGKIHNRRSKATEYKCVREIYNVRDQSIYFVAEKKIGTFRLSFWGHTAKGVALELDKKLIQRGLAPINILKKI